MTAYLSAALWQQQNPSALTPRAAMFQQVLDTHTPKSLPGAMRQITSKAMQARLGSSPSFLLSSPAPNTEGQPFYSQLARVGWSSKK